LCENEPFEERRRAELSSRHLAGDPRVTQHIGGRVAHSDVMLEQVSDQVLGVLADVAPVSGREVVDALLDPLEQVLLAVVALLAPVPATVDAALACEWTLTGEHNVHNDAQAPQVTALVVAHVVDEGLDHFGCQVLGRADWRAQLGSGHRRG